MRRVGMRMRKRRVGRGKKGGKGHLIGVVPRELMSALAFVAKHTWTVHVPYCRTRRVCDDYLMRTQTCNLLGRTQ